MQHEESPTVFNEERAASYDKQFAELAPMKDALHLLMRIVLSDLPADARVLCVGAGTGAELSVLAEAFPRWQFAVVEPAAAMLDICRKRAEERSFTDRCTFHHGYVSGLEFAEPFDAATSILVSHFLVDPTERRRFFEEICQRVRPGGYLVSADIASDMSAASYQSLLNMWVRMLQYAEMPQDKVDKFRASCGVHVAVLPPHDIASILTSAGLRLRSCSFRAY